jgi:uncharacterized protein (DUF427 family)/membrane-associated phospholipid phosphatase
VDRPSRPRARPLLSRPARRLAVTLVAACVVVIGVLGALVARQSQAGWLDAGIDASIKARLAAHLGAAMDVVGLGNPGETTIICAILVLACLALRRFRGALLVAVSVPLASGITELVLKPAFGRTMGGALSYPSGHETGVSAMAVTVIVLLLGPSRPPLPAWLRWVLAVAVAAVLPVLSVCLVGVGYHYLTDTIGGAAVGTGTVLATALGLDALVTRLAARRRNDRAGQAVATGMASGHTITITPANARIEVTVGGEKLADSTRAVLLEETGSPARYYLPREDVRTDLLQPTATESTCPFKGQASYWSAQAGGQLHQDIVWSYESPIPDAAGIAGLMCFWTERGAELTVDGALLPA